jgi:hypothetical protein
MKAQAGAGRDTDPLQGDQFDYGWTGQRDPTAGRLTMVGPSSPRLLTATCP